MDQTSMDRASNSPAPGKRRRLSKGMYIIPSLFTTANMALGYYAILSNT